MLVLLVVLLLVVCICSHHGGDSSATSSIVTKVGLSQTREGIGAAVPLAWNTTPISRWPPEPCTSRPEQDLNSLV